MARFIRFRFQPVRPMGKDGRKITACKQHLELTRKIATEGTVLLKNDGTLPLKKGARVSLFGRGACEYIFGGGGSGDVSSNIKISLADALQAADEAGQLQLFHPLHNHMMEVGKDIPTYLQENFDALGYSEEDMHALNTLPIPEELYRQAVEFGGTAIFTVLRHSSEGSKEGDNGDRHGGKGDFELFDEEARLLEQLTKDFDSVVVVLVSPGPVNTEIYAKNPKVNAVLYPMYGGSFAGNALVDILLGKAYPSGHLQDTLAVSMDDYPYSDHFFDSRTHVDYTEDIFVGYRWFETFCPEKVVYPFGFGLGYTTFDVKKESAAISKNTVTVKAAVTNTGSFNGKEVVQLYLTAPQGKLGKAKKVLTAFAKTRELKPGESQMLTLTFDLRQFASFDDLGKVAESCFVLEKGEYTVSMGVNVRDVEKVLTFDWAEDTIVRRCKPYMAPKELKERLTADGTLEPLPQPKPMKHPLRRYIPKAPINPIDSEAVDYNPMILEEALEQNKLDEFIAQLTDDELTSLLHGCASICGATTGCIGIIPNPVTYRGAFARKSIPAVPTCDGPAGFRTLPRAGISATYFPSSNTLSQTWNLKLAERFGKTVALEIKENNAGIWLAPALNIHRTPLCGRNFEYISEDPLTTGLFGAAIVNGVQSQRIACTVKHFCCNNKEGNRVYSDSRVSQRALREIYLRGFEICIKKASPKCLMTGYNIVNGERCSGHWEMLNGILKEEWKYPGVVMTDWGTYSLLEDDLYGGNDVRMPWKINGSFPGAPKELDLVKMVQEGTLDRGVCMEAARRVLTMMDHFE